MVGSASAKARPGVPPAYLHTALTTTPARPAPKICPTRRQPRAPTSSPAPPVWFGARPHRGMRPDVDRGKPGSKMHVLSDAKLTAPRRRRLRSHQRPRQPGAEAHGRRPPNETRPAPRSALQAPAPARRQGVRRPPPAQMVTRQAAFPDWVDLRPTPHRHQRPRPIAASPTWPVSTPVDEAADLAYFVSFAKKTSLELGGRPSQHPAQGNAMECRSGRTGRALGRMAVWRCTASNIR